MTGERSEPPRIDVRMLGPDDGAVLERVASGVFDHAVDARLAREFLHDPRHHLAVALDGDLVVGFTSGVTYVHPDKEAQLWINEVGVGTDYRRRGIARRLVESMLAKGKELGCTEAWVGTEVHNQAARRLYAAAGGREDPEPFVLVSFPLGKPR